MEGISANSTARPAMSSQLSPPDGDFCELVRGGSGIEELAEVDRGAGGGDEAVLGAVQETGADQFADRAFDPVAGSEAGLLAGQVTDQLVGGDAGGMEVEHPPDQDRFR